MNLTKKIVFGAIAVIIIPFLFFILCEWGLRVAHIGKNVSFFQTCDTAEGSICYNPHFAQTFFDPSFQRHPEYFSFSKNKKASTYRIFILGGSAAKGFPCSSVFIFSYMKKMLSSKVVNIQFEVINLASDSYNSHVLLEIAKELPRFSPDMIVVYSGNNEIIGPYGASSVFSHFFPSYYLVKLSTGASKTRIVQGLNYIKMRLVFDRNRYEDLRQEDHLTKELDEKLKANKINGNDWKLAKNYDFFKRNLSALVSGFVEKDIPILLCAVGSNLKDWAPFSGENNSNANKHFQQGNEFLDVGDIEEARKELILARDKDELRFRASSQINKIIRQVSTQNGAIFLNIPEALDQNSKIGVAGNDLFYEYVHLNFRGNYLLARIIAEKIEADISGIHESAEEYLSFNDAKRILGYSELSELEIYYFFEGWIKGRPPFTYMKNYLEIVKNIAHQLRQSQYEVERKGPEWFLDFHRQALEQGPEDPFLNFSMGKILMSLQRFQEALSFLKRASKGMPNNVKLKELISLAEQGRPVRELDL